MNRLSQTYSVKPFGLHFFCNIVKMTLWSDSLYKNLVKLILYCCIKVLQTHSLWFTITWNNIQELSLSLSWFLGTSNLDNNAVMSYCAAKDLIPSHRWATSWELSLSEAGHCWGTTTNSVAAAWTGADVRMVNADLWTFIAPFHRLRALMSLSKLDLHPLLCRGGRLTSSYHENTLATMDE